LSDLPDDLPLREHLDRRREILDRIFGPDDPALRQRLLPRLTPPDTFDDEDRAAARALLGKYASISLDEGAGRQVLENVAARRRLPPNVVVELHFPAGFAWRVQFDPAPAIHYALAHPDLAEPIELGYRDPHFKLPILRWAEVDALARHLPPHERVLLLSTAWRAPDEERGPVMELVTRVLREAEVLHPEAIAELVERLVEPIDVRWRLDPALGWVNDGNHSVRNPQNEDLDASGFARLRTFFRAAGTE
jgi:hypothetical protein